MVLCCAFHTWVMVYNFSSIKYSLFFIYPDAYALQVSVFGWWRSSAADIPILCALSVSSVRASLGS